MILKLLIFNLLMIMLFLFSCAKQSSVKPKNKSETKQIVKPFPKDKVNNMTTPDKKIKTQIEVSSKSWKNEGTISKRYLFPRSGGKNISPQISWGSVPDNCKEILLVIVDHHKVANHWLHWVVTLPPSITKLKEGASNKMMPDNSVQYINSFGNKKYDGPSPPKGTAHDYHIVIFALSQKVKFTGKLTWNSIIEKIKNKNIAKGEIKSYFQNK